MTSLNAVQARGDSFGELLKSKEIILKLVLHVGEETVLYAAWWYMRGRIYEVEVPIRAVVEGKVIGL